jgi:hypothetical protein
VKLLADLLEIQVHEDLELRATAVFDKRFRGPDGQFLYRYSLTRAWHGAGLRKLVFLMLNPSIADAFKVDNTVRRCMIWAQKWKFGILEVVNIFAFRATKPAAMKKAADPIGPLNDFFIAEACRTADLVVAAWGAHGAFQNRGRQVAGLLLKGVSLTTLVTIEDGHPKHPLYIDGDLKPKPFAYP